MDCEFYDQDLKTIICGGCGHYLCACCKNLDMAYRESLYKVCQTMNIKSFWERFNFLDHAYNPKKHGDRVEFFKKFIEFPVDILKEKV